MTGASARDEIIYYRRFSQSYTDFQYDETAFAV